MENNDIEWIEVNNHLIKGVIGTLELFYIYPSNVDEFILEANLPIKKKNYTLDTEKKCKLYANKILLAFTHCLIRR